MSTHPDELGRGRADATMTTPKVTEIRRPLQAVTPDPFIGVQPASPRANAVR